MVGKFMTTEFVYENCMLVYLEDGRVIGITDNDLCVLYPCEKDFYDHTNVDKWKTMSIRREK